MGAVGAGNAKGTEENEEKMESRKGGKEKSVFPPLFCPRAWRGNLLVLPSTSITVIASEENVRPWAAARAPGSLRICVHSCI